MKRLRNILTGALLVLGALSPLLYRPTVFPLPKTDLWLSLTAWLNVTM